MRRSLVFAAFATTMVATPALAQSFTGPRIEAHVGYDAARADDGLAGTSDTLDGIRVGGAIGYDVELGRTLVAGVEAGVGWSLGDAETQVVGANRFRTDSGRDIDLSVRLGAKISPRTLLYAKAGWANSRFSAEVRTPGGTSPLVSRVSSNEDGLRVGAGVEHMLGEHAYAKAEYRYTSYGHDLSRHQALVGFGWRF